jgi:DsrE/DsrF-like family
MATTKTAIVVLSDPQGGEEALGRVFNALAATYDFKQKHQDVQLVFQGTGTRWTGLLTRIDHPAHALYKAVEDKVAGVSSGCADVFGARQDAEANGFSLITSNAVPGTSGLPSLAAYAADGYTILTF